MKFQDYIAVLATLGYTFRMNALNDDIEVNGKPITDGLYAKIRVQLRDLGHTRRLTAFEDAWKAEAYDHLYNPIQEYLDMLPPYSLLNDEPWIIPKLASYFKDVDNVFSTWLLKWMVGAVAKVQRAGTTQPVQNPMLVLVGPQNLGKSQFARWLCSGLATHFIEAQINTEDKDTWLRLGSHFIWEVAELQAVTKRQDREALKDFITRDKITTRKAYGRFDVRMSAVASLIGTVNENGTGFLNDPTGNRRFLTCELTAIDWAYTNIDPNEAWAEAAYLYQHRPDSWVLAPDEVTKRDEINLRFQEDDPIEDLILKYFEITKDANDFVSSVDLRETLENFGLKGTTKQNSMMIASALKNLGVWKDKVNNQRGFRGIKKKGLVP
jgi:predicted P-loop ATPase